MLKLDFSSIRSYTMKLTLIFMSLTFGAFAVASQWKIDDAHSSARFKVGHMMISNVSGEITQFKGTFDLDDKTRTVKAIQTALGTGSVSTQNTERDNHLKSPDFLDAKKYPTISFKSNKITKEKDGSYKIVGSLTLHGVTKEVTFTDGELKGPAKDPWGNQRAGFVAKAKINRQDFGIVWNKKLDGGGVLVGNDVAIDVECEIIAGK